MLNRLKKKFILVNMLMVGGLIILIVISISALTLNQAIKSSMELLDDAVNLQADPEENHDYVLFLMVDDSAIVIEGADLNNPLSEADLLTYGHEILLKDEGEGLLLRHGVLYDSRKTDYGTYIAYTPITVVAQPAEDVFFNASTVASGALFLLFLLSRKLANTVIAPTERAWDNQKRFVADASHDLKTPLTVIMANNEILMSHPEKTVGEQMKWLESTKDEGEYMTSLVNKMLELAKSESLNSKVELAKTNVSEITEKAVLQLEPLAFENGIEIKSNIENDIIISSSDAEFYKLAQTLIDNAVKYAPKNSFVFVSLTTNKKEAILMVNNKGDAIPPEQLEHIFDRFYRTDDARTKGGFGLGLSIAKNVATALGGEIYVSSDSINGTTFTVKFKL